jgi:hypothetical protein
LNRQAVALLLRSDPDEQEDDAAVLHILEDIITGDFNEVHFSTGNMGLCPGRHSGALRHTEPRRCASVSARIRKGQGA